MSNFIFVWNCEALRSLNEIAVFAHSCPIIIQRGDIDFDNFFFHEN